MHVLDYYYWRETERDVERERERDLERERERDY